MSSSSSGSDTENVVVELTESSRSSGSQPDGIPSHKDGGERIQSRKDGGGVDDQDGTNGEKTEAEKKMLRDHPLFNRLISFLEGGKFLVVLVVLIVLDICCLGLEILEALNWLRHEDHIETVIEVAGWISMGILVLFVIEVTYRLWYHNKNYFRKWFNIFDMCLVYVSFIIEIVVMATVPEYCDDSVECEVCEVCSLENDATVELLSNVSIANTTASGEPAEAVVTGGGRRLLSRFLSSTEDDEEECVTSDTIQVEIIVLLIFTILFRVGRVAHAFYEVLHIGKEFESTERLSQIQEKGEGDEGKRGLSNAKSLRDSFEGVA